MLTIFSIQKRKQITLFLIITFLYLGISIYIYQSIYRIVLSLGNIFGQPILYSSEVKASLWEKKLSLCNFQLSLLSGEKLLEISEITIELSGYFPRIRKISIQKPLCWLQQFPDQRWNWAFFHSPNVIPQPITQPTAITNDRKIDPKTKIDSILRILRPILAPNAEIEIVGGQLQVSIPKFLQENILIKDIGLSVQRQNGLFAHDHYCIQFQFYNHFTQSMSFYGDYHTELGLSFQAKQPCTIILSDVFTQLKPNLPLFQAWKQTKINGQIELSKIEFVGLTPTNPDIDLNFNFAQTHGLFCLEDICFNLNNIQSNFAVEKGRLRNLNVSIKWNHCEFEIHQSQLSLSQESYLNFSLKNLSLSPTLVQFVEQIADISIQPYYTMLQPNGSISIHGWIRYEPTTTTWDWQIKPILENGSIQYKGMKVDAISLEAVLTPKEIAFRQFQWNMAKGNFFLEKAVSIQFPSLALEQNNPLVVAFRGLALDKPTIFLVPEIDELWEILQPEGVVDGRIIVENNVFSLPKAEITTNHLLAAFEEIPYPVHIHFAKASFENGCLTLEAIHARSRTCDGTVFVKGKVWLMDKPHPIAYNIDFEVKSLILDQTAYHTFALEPNPNSWLRDIQSVWDHIRPQGKISVIGHIEKERYNKNPPVFDIKIIPLGTGISYIDFPYPVSDVKGTISIRPGTVTFPNIQAKKSGGNLVVNGKILARPQQGLDVFMDVVANNLPLDADLSFALGSKYQKIWNEFSPVGRINLSVKLQKKAEEKEVIWQAQAHLNEISACYQEFPYRLHKIRGEIMLAPENFEFKNLVAKKDDGMIMIQGYFKHGQFAVDLDVKDINIDQELRQSLTKEAKKITDDFDCQGLLSGHIHLERLNPAQDLFWKARITLHKIVGKYRLFPYRITQGNGQIELQANRCNILHFQGKHKESIISVSGEIVQDSAKIVVRGKDIVLDADLQQALPQEHFVLWKDFQPDGRMDVFWQFSKQKEQSSTFLHIVPKDCKVCYHKFPYTLTNLSVLPHAEKSGIYIKDGNVEIHNLSSVVGNTKIELQGVFFNLQNSDLTQNLVNLNIYGENLILSQNLRNGLAQFFPDLIESWQPEGKIEQIRLKLSQYAGKEKYWHYQLNVFNLNAVMKEGSFIQKISGNIELSGYNYQDRHHAEGQIYGGEVMLKNLALKRFQSKIQSFHDYLFFHNIEGNFYQGKCVGSLVLDTSKYGAYKGFFNIQEAYLREIEEALNQSGPSNGKDTNFEFKKPDKPSKPTSLSGLVTSEIFFQGNRQDTDTLTGKGFLLLKDGEIWQFPIFLSILDLFSLPSRPAFRDGEITFSLLKSKIILSSIRFDSSLLAISGKGSIDYDGNLNLVLLTHFTSDLLPRIPFVDKIWDGLRQDLLSFSVQGTLSKPSIVPKPFDDVKNLFESNK